MWIADTIPVALIVQTSACTRWQKYNEKLKNLQKVVAMYANRVQPAIAQCKGELIKAVTSPPLHVFLSLGEQMSVVKTAAAQHPW